jgi:hypothetical protein
MHAAAESVGRLGIDGSKLNQAAESGLDVAAWAAKTVIKVKMTKCGVEIVAPHQDYDTAAKPDAFRVSGRAVDCMCRLDEFVGLALAVFDGIGCCIGGIGRRRLGLILRAKITALCNRTAHTEQQGDSENGDAARNQPLEPKQHSTHKFPDSCYPPTGHST